MINNDDDDNDYELGSFALSDNDHEEAERRAKEHTADFESYAKALEFFIDAYSISEQVEL